MEKKPISPQEFSSIAKILHKDMKALKGAKVAKSRGDVEAKAGIYLFSKGEEHQYIGRSKNLKSRYGGHGSTNSSFAFLMARKKTKKTKASYKNNNKNGHKTRKELQEDKKFQRALREANEEIKGMDFRFLVVEEIDPCEHARHVCECKQALLEIYCAMVLGTPYNNFNTH